MSAYAARQTDDDGTSHPDEEYLSTLPEPLAKHIRKIRKSFLKKTSNKNTDNIASAKIAGERLSLNAEFRRHAEINQWNSRRDLGYPWRMSSFDFIKSVYRDWLGKGMVRADLKEVDEPLWAKLCNDIKAHKKRTGKDLPDDLDLPTLAEANLRGLPPGERRRREAIREYERERKAVRNMREPDVA